MKLVRYCAACLFSMLATTAAASDFDGSLPLICAPVTTMDCVRGDHCLTGLPEDVGAPAFMRMDFVKRTVTGPKATSPILLMDKTDNQILMQGREAGYGWAIALDTLSGEMTVTLAERNGAFVLFGSCTPL